MQAYFKVLFILLMLLNTSFVKLSVGFPAKDLLLLGMSGLLVLAYNRQAAIFLREHHALFLVFIAFAAVGSLNTLLNGRGFGIIFESSLRIVVQPMLIMICTYLMVVIAGLRFTATVFIGFALLSGFVAILQFADLDQAWQLRALLGRFQVEPSAKYDDLENFGRPMGLSLTPIMYSYHLISAYILGNLFYRRGLMRPSYYFVFVVAVLAMSIANGTRSLVAGIVLHEVVFNAMRFDRRSIIMLAALAIGGVVVIGLLQDSSRVTTLSDPSAIGRVVLFEYGLQLAADNPLGLGWGFRPSDVAWLYWQELAGAERAHVVFNLRLHNAYLNFFIMYGVPGVLILVVVAIVDARRLLEIALFSTAYLFHATVHNDGIFLGDDYYWFAFAMFLYVRELQPSAADSASKYASLQLQAR